MTSTSRRCFIIETLDDEEEEAPEKFMIVGNAISHFIEFDPTSALIWIVDDESKIAIQQLRNNLYHCG